MWSLEAKSITLSGSKLVGDQRQTSFEPDGVKEFGFKSNIMSAVFISVEMRVGLSFSAYQQQMATKKS